MTELHLPPLLDLAAMTNTFFQVATFCWLQNYRGCGVSISGFADSIICTSAQAGVKTKMQHQCTIHAHIPRESRSSHPIGLPGF
jgi:hypothetical protein